MLWGQYLQLAPIESLWALELWLRHRMRNGDSIAKTEWELVKHELDRRRIKCNRPV